MQEEQKSGQPSRWGRFWGGVKSGASKVCGCFWRNDPEREPLLVDDDVDAEASEPKEEKPAEQKPGWWYRFRRWGFSLSATAFSFCTLYSTFIGLIQGKDGTDVTPEEAFKKLGEGDAWAIFSFGAGVLGWAAIGVFNFIWNWRGWAPPKGTAQKDKKGGGYRFCAWLKSSSLSVLEYLVLTIPAGLVVANLWKAALDGMLSLFGSSYEALGPVGIFLYWTSFLYCNFLAGNGIVGATKFQLNRLKGLFNIGTSKVKTALNWVRNMLLWKKKIPAATQQDGNKSLQDKMAALFDIFRNEHYPKKRVILGIVLFALSMGIAGAGTWSLWYFAMSFFKAIAVVTPVGYVYSALVVVMNTFLWGTSVNDFLQLIARKILNKDFKLSHMSNCKDVFKTIGTGFIAFCFGLSMLYVTLTNGLNLGTYIAAVPVLLINYILCHKAWLELLREKNWITTSQRDAMMNIVNGLESGVNELKEQGANKDTYNRLLAAIKERVPVEKDSSQKAVSLLNEEDNTSSETKASISELDTLQQKLNELISESDCNIQYSPV